MATVAAAAINVLDKCPSVSETRWLPVLLLTTCIPYWLCKYGAQETTTEEVEGEESARKSRVDIASKALNAAVNYYY